MSSTPFFPWRPATDEELDRVATEWSAAGRTPDMEVLDAMYSTLTHRPEVAPMHWASVNRRLQRRVENRRAYERNV